MTDAMRRAAALNIADELVGQSDFEADQRDEIADDILSVAIGHMDGYEIAKALDDRKYWCCTLAIAETLDGFYVECDAELERAIAQWAAENPMEPPLPVGASVVVRNGRGVISQVSPWHPATYIVRVGERHLVVAFEDVKDATA
jgi:hypothetical protein